MRLFPLSLLITISLSATSIPPVSFTDLVQQSDQIVTGRIVSSSVGWGVDHKFLWTRYVVSVEQNLKGGASKQITISEPGGELNGRRLEVDGAVSYIAGERVALFLHRYPSGTLRTVGWAQGKFSIDQAGRVHPAAQLGFVPDKSLANLDGVRLGELQTRITRVLTQGGAAK